jgi:hypothetical protein
MEASDGGLVWFDAAPAVQACAEALPFRSSSFDAVLEVLTVHHWKDQAKGFFRVRSRPSPDPRSETPSTDRGFIGSRLGTYAETGPPAIGLFAFEEMLGYVRIRLMNKPNALK